MRIQRLTWAGIKVEVGGTTLFVDAIEGATNWHQPEIVPLAAGTQDRHALVTHAHDDHFDPAALARVLGDGGSVLCHRAILGRVARPGLWVRGVEVHEPVLLGWLAADLMAIAVPAADGWGDAQVSWIVDGDGRRIIHCGDTLWHGHWWNIARQYGPFDAAFLPINGVTYSRGRFTGSTVPATLTPEQAAMAAHILGARIAIPIHYGFVSDPVHYREVPDAEAEFLAEARKRGVRPHLLAPGGWLDVDALIEAET